ncbi:antibiotic biosynthesis monooxygenase family protein [Streptomyces fumanus]|uniref:antibiotic biosynthesis monooxygenase family protein n=1 Tax=Streptomyces fumanus TaxID=67302 RepID=UPI00227D8FB9|nr:antibiotic biosynthesis monooxygenase [Streptomyces fumanus]
MVNFLRVTEQQGPEAVERLVRAYHESSKALQGTPGLLRNELLRSLHEPERFAVLSEWEGRDAFTAWEQGARHKGQTAPVREFADSRPARMPFVVYDVVDAYSE